MMLRGFRGIGDDTAFTSAPLPQTGFTSAGAYQPPPPNAFLSVAAPAVQIIPDVPNGVTILGGAAALVAALSTGIGV